MCKRDCQNIRTMDYLKLLCLSDKIQASKRERERKNAWTQSKLPLKGFCKSTSNLCLRSLSTYEIYAPLGKLIEISMSPHFVNRLDTNDPNGSTAAPVWAKSLIYVVNHKFF